MTNSTNKINELLSSGVLTKEGNTLYLTNPTDMLLIHADNAPVIISVIECTDDNRYIGVDTNEYPLENYTLSHYQLSSNTTFVPDWSKIDESHNYLAMDEDREWVSFGTEPEYSEDEGVWTSAYHADFKSQPHITFVHHSPENSLLKRP